MVQQVDHSRAAVIPDRADQRRHVHIAPGAHPMVETHDQSPERPARERVILDLCDWDHGGGFSRNLDCIPLHYVLA